MELAQEQGDDDLLTVDIGRLFLSATPMLSAFEYYCSRQVRFWNYLFMIGKTEGHQHGISVKRNWKLMKALRNDRLSPLLDRPT